MAGGERLNLVFGNLYALKIETEFYIGAGIIFNKEFVVFDEAKNALLIIDHNVVNQAYVVHFVKELGEIYEDLTIIENTEIEPRTSTVDRMVTQCKESRLNAVFGVGGGSTLDTAKAIAILLTNPGIAENYQGMNKASRPGIPSIMIPTIAGSGAEITPSAVLINTEKKFKGGINGRFVAPTRALLDPGVTAKAPVSSTVYAAFDAFVHALESYTCKLASPIVKMFGTEALRILLRAIPRIADKPEDLLLREDLLLAAELAAIALMHSEPGPMASFGYQLAIRHGVPHGLANAIMIDKTMAIQIEKGADYRFLYELLPQKPSVEGQKEKSLAAYQYVSEIINNVNVPKNLFSYGFMPEHYEELASFVDYAKKGFPAAVTGFHREDLLNVLMSLS